MMVFKEKMLCERGENTQKNIAYFCSGKDSRGMRIYSYGSQRYIDKYCEPCPAEYSAGDTGFKIFFKKRNIL